MKRGGDYRQALRAIRPALVMVAAISVVVNLLMLTGPLFMLQVYDRVLSSGSVATLQGLLTIVVVLYAFLGFYNFLRQRILSRAACRLDEMLSAPAFARWLNPAASEAAREQPLRDIETLRGFLSGPALGLFDVPWIPFYVGLIFLIHPSLGALTLGGAVVVTIAAFLNQYFTDPSLAQSMRMEGAERDFTVQGRRNAEMISVLGMRGRILARWREMHLRRLGAGQIGSDRGQGFSAFSKTFRMFLQSALLAMAAYLTLRQEISAGMIIASSVISGRALAPVDQVIGQWRGILRAREAHRNCLGLLDGPAERPAASPDVRLPAPSGALRVRNVSRLQPGAGSAASRGRILDHVSFALDAGDGLGVIGASASGKSSLARILVGAIRPDTGEVRLDGAPHDQWPDEELGRHIGYLPQVVEMLPGTVRDNISRFDPLARDADVIATARLAGVHEMILRLPAGYATMLGGAEQPLSGGQVQRLALARALYGNPRLIVLDEPNSNLDQAGDTVLTEAIAEMRRRGSTVVVMAHRPGALASVNKILVLKDGRAMAFGLKEEILGLGTAQGAPGAGQPLQDVARGVQQGAPQNGGAAVPSSAASVVTPIRRETPARGRAALFALFNNLGDEDEAPDLRSGPHPAPLVLGGSADPAPRNPAAIAGE